jgi:hypothetical protein
MSSNDTNQDPRNQIVNPSQSSNAEQEPLRSPFKVLLPIVLLLLAVLLFGALHD